jgi:hypothetical protein
MGGGVSTASRCAARLAVGAVGGLGADMATVHLVAGEDTLLLAAARGVSKHFEQCFALLPLTPPGTAMARAQRSGVVVQTADAAGDAAYERQYQDVLQGEGVAGSISAPVTDDAGAVVAVLSVFYRTRGVYDAMPVARLAGDLGPVLSATSGQHTEVSDAAEQVVQLRTALATRGVIEQAKGIVMARTGRDADGAFALLLEQSQAENRKVREIAMELVTNASRPDRGR